jgi:plasmid stabilization system protein ParE
MSFQYILAPSAFQEFEDAVYWYKTRSLKVAENFAETVFTKIVEICRDPYRYRNTYKTFRETSIKRFPFHIIYFIDEEKQLVIISSVFHHKRNLKRKFKK